MIVPCSATAYIRGAQSAKPRPPSWNWRLNDKATHTTVAAAVGAAAVVAAASTTIVVPVFLVGLLPTCVFVRRDGHGSLHSTLTYRMQDREQGIECGRVREGKGREGKGSTIKDEGKGLGLGLG